MRTALCASLLCLATTLALAQPRALVSVSLKAEREAPDTPPALLVGQPLTLQVYLSNPEGPPFRECSLTVEVPEALRDPGETDPARTYVLSGRGLRTANLDIELVPRQAGEHALAFAAAWGSTRAQAQTTLLIAATKDDPDYFLTRETNAGGAGSCLFRARRLRIQQAAEFLSKATGLPFEAEPEYASTPVSKLEWTYRREPRLADVLRGPRLTYARAPDGKHFLRPGVGPGMFPPDERSIRKNEQGRFFIWAPQLDGVATLDYLANLAGVPVEIRDTLMATPVKLQWNETKPFEEVLTLLCQQAGWQWAREGEKYVVSVKRP